MATKPKAPKPPTSIRITAKRTYETVYTDEFVKDGSQLGECRWDPPQIVVKNGQTEIETFKTFIHEAIHAVDHENNVGLTENQVLKLEEGLYRVLKLNKLI